MREMASTRRYRLELIWKDDHFQDTRWLGTSAINKTLSSFERTSI